MASKKANAGDRAAQFLAKIGTAGGPMGSPSLTTFGAGDLQQQVISGLTDAYASIRARDLAPQIGSPNNPQRTMSADLDAAYLKLNLPGSPLPRNGLLTPQFLNAAEFTQDHIIVNEQQMLMRFMPPRGQLPMGIQPPVPRKKR
jgi:hypothetical protein